MAVQHSDITDALGRHEPKGADTASSGDIYVSDGAASGAWKTGAGQHYADLYISSGATTQALSAASAYARLDPGTEWKLNTANGLSTTIADGTITLTNAGVYLVEFWITFTTAALAAGTLYSFKYAIDGTPVARVLTVQKNTAGADRLTCAAQGLATVTAGQVLSIYVAGDGTSSGTNITVNDAGLTAVLLKEA